jgi:acyl-CoA synthetase (AMP-forming)/AMP-acid ligase II
VALSYVPRADGSLGGGRFVSQDLARWRDDELQILGRLDRIMNVRGHKVNPAEVEQAIAKMPGVRAVYVHGMEPSSGGGRCINVVVAGNEGTLTRETIVAWCRARLADYKIPTHVSIVSALPVSPRGKIDRAAIARLLRSPISPDA